MKIKNKKIGLKLWWALKTANICRRKNKTKWVATYYDDKGTRKEKGGFMTEDQAYKFLEERNKKCVDIA